MFRKLAVLCLCFMAVAAVEAQADGLLGRKYLGLGFQIGEFGNDLDKKTMEKTKGVIATYNYPFRNNIDIGASVEFNRADGKDTVNKLNYDLDFKIGGVVTYATLFKPATDEIRLFVRPQIGLQKSVTKWKSADNGRKNNETDLYFGFDGGVEYDLGRCFITPALGVSHADETNINGKLGLGVNVTEIVALNLGGNYQLNHDHDYVVSAGVTIKF